MRNLSAFSDEFFELIVLHVDVFFFFLLIRVYLIYHAVFQVSRKVIQLHIYMYLCLPLGSVVKESPCNEGDLGSIPGFGKICSEGHDKPLQYSCLENLMDRGA